jgi:PAS domain S-box-containing protein
MDSFEKETGLDGRERDYVRSLLQESERRFHAVFDQSPQFLSLLEPDGTLIEANQTALAYRGVTLDQIVGRKYWDSFGKRITADMQQVIQAAVQAAAAGHTQQYELDIRADDNQIATIDFSITPIRDRVGEVVMMIAQGRDVTELKSTVNRLRLAEFRLEEAQRIAHMGHWDYDLIGETASWSNTLFEIFGMVQNDEAPGLAALGELVHPEDMAYLREALQHSFMTGRPYEVDFRVIRPDGVLRNFFAAGGPVRNEHGDVVRMAGIVQDVTGRRALEQSLASSVERLSTINAMGQTVASTVDMAEIYGRVLSAGRKLLATDAMIFFLHEGQELCAVAVNQVGQHDLLGRRIPDDVGIAGEALKMSRPVWVSGEECRRRRSVQLAQASGMEPRSIIAVPVTWQDEVLGVLEAVDERDDAFTLDDVRALQAIANWTAIALGKTRQHRSLERRLQESEAIAHVSRALSETLEPQEILDLIVETAHTIVPRSDWAVIHLLRGRPERLDPVAVAGTDEDLSDYVIGPEEGIAGLVLRHGLPINVSDSQADPRSSAYAHNIGLKALLVAPIQARNRRLGTISLHCLQPAAFTEEDERLLTILAVQAGLAIENAHLFDSQRRARAVAEIQRERLRVLADRIVTTQEEERLRISRELHDEAGQALTSLKISLDLIRATLPAEQAALRDRLADLAALTGETMETLRTLAHDLRPPGLDTFGLNVALEGLCNDFAARTSLPVSYSGLELPDLPTAMTLTLYRLAQEALTNIAKHAGAQQVWVDLSMTDNVLQLSIADDGRGFIFDPNKHPGNGIGLVSLQERADLIGGVLEITTNPGQGTRIRVRVLSVEPEAAVRAAG